MPPLIIAHRTCPKDAPENSLEGIRTATRLGADVVEVDLRLSLDQRPFLMHDWTLHRTTGWWPPVELVPSRVVRKLRLNGASEAVPSLGQALDALAPPMKMAVDVKTPWAVWRLAEEVRKRRLETRVLAWCTSALAVRYLHRRAPAIETAYLRNDVEPAAKLAYLAKAARLGAGAVSAHWHAIDAAFVSNAHDLGLKVYAWHQDYDLAPAKLSAGLEGVVTDYPVRLRQALDALALSQ